jgi:hypothetical protein
MEELPKLWAVWIPCEGWLRGADVIVGDKEFCSDVAHMVDGKVRRYDASLKDIEKRLLEYEKVGIENVKFNLAHPYKPSFWERLKSKWHI